MISNISQEEVDGYVAAIVKLYLDLPETPSRTSPNDRKIAAVLHARGIKRATIESAFLLASMRRLGRSPDMPPLTPIRSLAYFFPVIQELLDNPIPDDYVEYLRRKVRLPSYKNQAIKCG